MRILIDARLYGLEHAGLGRYVLNLVDELKKLRTEEEFVILLRKKYFQRLSLPKNWKKVLTDFRHYSLAEQIKLSKIIKAESPDIIHFPHFNVPIFYRGRYVVTIHDLIMHKSKGSRATTLPSYKYFIKRLGYKLVFKKAIEGSVRIIVPSNAIKKELVNYYKVENKKVVVTYEGLDEKLSVSKNAKQILSKFGLGKRYFIYVGNAYPHKNLERAIEATSSLNERYNGKIYLAIAGSRSIFTKRLKKAIAKCGAQKCVKLLGYVSDGDLGALLANSVAFVYPSFDEGFGLQGLESIASGTLVLASDIPVFKEIYQDNVIYFNPYDFTDIAKVMEEALNLSKKDREKIVSKGQKFIKCYSWSKMARQTLEIYKGASV